MNKKLPGEKETWGYGSRGAGDLGARVSSRENVCSNALNKKINTRKDWNLSGQGSREETKGREQFGKWIMK